jgi:uncharacterized C2H2 Zn-finger protein
MAEEGVIPSRCPHCKALFRLRVRAKTKVVVEPMLWGETKGRDGVSK